MNAGGRKRREGEREGVNKGRNEGKDKRERSLGDFSSSARN